MTTTKERKRSAAYYQYFTTDQLLLQLADWYKLTEMFGTCDYYAEQIDYISSVLEARVKQGRNVK